MKLYLIEDAIKKACFLTEIIKMLQGLQTPGDSSFTDGFAGKWLIEEFSPQRYLKETESHKQAQAEIKQVISNPELLLQAVEDKNGICLIDIKLPKEEGYDHVCAQILEKLKTQDRQEEISYFHEIKRCLGDNPDNTLAAILLAICKHRQTKCLIISMAIEMDKSYGLGALGFKSIAFPNEPSVDHSKTIKEIAKKILEMTDPIWWFLSPPGQNDYPHIQWFDTSNAYPSHVEVKGREARSNEYYDKHLRAVADRYPNWANERRSAIALVHSNEFRVRKRGNPNPFPCYYLEDFFGRISVEGLEKNDRISLPVEPGLPLLLALKNLFQSVSIESAVVVRRYSILKDEIKGTVIAIGVQTSAPCWDVAQWLWQERVENVDQEKNSPGGDVYKNFRLALYGRIEHNFRGAKPPLASLLEGINERFIVPWITDNFLGVSWKSK